MVMVLPPTEKKPSRARLSGGSSSAACAGRLARNDRIPPATSAAAAIDTSSKVPWFMFVFLPVRSFYDTAAGAGNMCYVCCVRKRGACCCALSPCGRGQLQLFNKDCWVRGCDLTPHPIQDVEPPSSPLPQGGRAHNYRWCVLRE